MQRTMLAAVQATAERLIASRYLMEQMFERSWTTEKRNTSVIAF